MEAGPYSLLTNLWGLSDATSGYGCAAVTSLSDDNIVAWSNKWEWNGDNKIKSYTNMQLNLNQDLNKQLSAIKTMPVYFL